jgi:uncharacterized membrane protein HdeD (DUF308 family)
MGLSLDPGLSNSAAGGLVLAAARRLVGIVLGVMIWQQLPSSALLILGLLLGINLVFSGFSFLMMDHVRLRSNHGGGLS